MTCKVFKAGQVMTVTRRAPPVPPLHQKTLIGGAAAGCVRRLQQRACPCPSCLKILSWTEAVGRLAVENTSCGA